MKIYPESAITQLEFDKIKNLLSHNCKTAYAKNKTEFLNIHTHIKYVETALQQSFEYKMILEQNLNLPNDFTLDIRADIKLLSISGSALSTDQFAKIKRLALSYQQISKWFTQERMQAFAALNKIMNGIFYEKKIVQEIDSVLDEDGNVKDDASDALFKIRTSLIKKRNEATRVFSRVIAKLNKAGYATDIEESFSNGRRVVAVFAEFKRQVKGILHGESDSRKTAFIEPEETIELNNEIFALENEERKEIIRILRDLTAALSIYASVLYDYLKVVGDLDFACAKAKLAIAMNGSFPNLIDKPIVDVTNAYHPLLVLYNKEHNKKTVPVSLKLNDDSRILVISGPNAGGKTVTMKTIGLNQIMLQSGLLVPVSPSSRMGIFKQLFIHIGDTQSLEFELSTYSSHLMHMKYFLENATGKTLFFIDELGSGTDPGLGGIFGEVILKELNKKHAIGIVTTHYLNLKIMANHTKGIINGAMQFDEIKLEPLYQLQVGKPGSSYTFSIAQRIGLPHHLIAQAKQLVDDDHFKLDKLLNRTEKDLQHIQKQKEDLHLILKENNRLKKELEQALNKEKHKQQVELLKQQNKISTQKLEYLKQTEKKLKQIVSEWRKAEDKNEVIKQIQNLLFKTNEKAVVSKAAKKINKKYAETGEALGVGTLVKMKKNYQVGTLKEIRGKRGIIQLGAIEMNVDLSDLVAVKKLSET